MQRIFTHYRCGSRKIIQLLFVAVFFASGFYALPFFYLDINRVLEVKHSLYAGFALAILIAMDFRLVRFDIFFAGCLGWLLVCIASGLIVQDVDADIYIKRMIQISFVWIFVTYVRQNCELFNFVMFKKIFSPWFIFFFGACLVFLSFDAANFSLVANGFGNNRVNFSIWLSQLVFVLFLRGLLSANNNEIPLIYHFCALPILAFQMFLGSRTGLFESLALYFIAMMFLRRSKVCATLIVFVALTAAWTFSPLSVDPAMDVTRALSLDRMSTHEWVDRLSSHRLDIAESAMSSLAPENLLVGKGMGNFHGFAIGQKWDVHSIYLRALGELGIVGLGILILIVLSPFKNIFPLNGRKISSPVAFGYFFLLLDILIGLIHPELLVTAISTCLVFWVVYAYLIDGDARGMNCVVSKNKIR